MQFQQRNSTDFKFGRILFHFWLLSNIFFFGNQTYIMIGPVFLRNKHHFKTNIFLDLLKIYYRCHEFFTNLYKKYYIKFIFIVYRNILYSHNNYDDIWLTGWKLSKNVTHWINLCNFTEISKCMLSKTW